MGPSEPYGYRKVVGDAAEVAGAAVGAPGLDSAVGVVLDGQDVGGEYLHSGVQGISHIAAVVGFSQQCRGCDLP